MQARLENITGWGNFPIVSSQVYRPETLERLQNVVRISEKVIPFGNKLSYGDSALYSTSIDMKKLDKILSFNQKTGVARVESGILLSDLLNVIIPRGWFVHVTPGTKFVTIGGCVGSDVHGKNHHSYGGFRKCVRSLEIVLADGKLISCSRKKNKELFNATIGGQGLIGVIYSIELQLKKVESSYVDVVTKKCSSMDEIFSNLDEFDKSFEYTVSWIDTFTSRGIVIAGNHTTGKLTRPPKQKFQARFFLPDFVLNKISMKLFNAFYYLWHKPGKKRMHFNSFFYPLDAIHNWNKIYGKRGFTQYQCVINSKEGIKEVIGAVSSNGGFLSVLKKFGKEDGMLSFPVRGYTLAMDFPITPSTKTLIQKLDQIVLKYKGRVYLAKDAFLNKTSFEQMYNTKEWKKIKEVYDANNKFTSNQAIRVGLSK